MLDYLKHIEQKRIETSRSLDKHVQSELGQYFTPAPIAHFMASLTLPTDSPDVSILDPGAGIGVLSVALAEKLLTSRVLPKSIQLVAYEVDHGFAILLTKHFKALKQKAASKGVDLSYTVNQRDFIEDAVYQLQFGGQKTFDYVILNPPYKKIHSKSRHRNLLKQLKLEVVNLYAAFLALAIELTHKGGQIIAIVPRSFCNGPYFISLRKSLLSQTSIRQMHLFESRDRAFQDDDVLQENVIVSLAKGLPQDLVTVSISSDATFSDFKSISFPFDRIVRSEDKQSFIHIPTTHGTTFPDSSTSLRYSLADLCIQVSTGPVVDFRLRQHIHQMPGRKDVPLIYPSHFNGKNIIWPIEKQKKPNAIELNSETQIWLYPKGYYTLTRRFSAKEERRRIVACVLNPAKLTHDWLGFENHLNVFHREKMGLPKHLAYGLYALLNSTMFDNYFRVFSGHTQVNATDLRAMRFPSETQMVELGRWAEKLIHVTQELIDNKIDELGWQKKPE